jgi:hypothetical protein
MRALGKTGLITLACLMALPAVARAQATIAGVVKDTSGAVLPGVTVEASSPALIEKSRVGVTDGSGQYRIENLRPGVYTVAYTLAGFNTVKREGIELTGTFTATVNAELRVGALEETITVTGESPIVDVQGTTRQSVIEHTVVDAIPAGRGPQGFYSYGLLLPGVVPGNTALQDVGGSSGTYMVRLSAHGGDGGDQLITQNGVGVGSLNDQGWFNRIVVNVAATKESAIDTAAISAEYSRGGVHVNIVPKDGGNAYEGTLFYTFANKGMQSSNITQELKDRGLPTQGNIRKTFDFNAGVGGPIKQDKLWFYAAALYSRNSAYTPGMYQNLNANNPNAWTYEPDVTRPAFSDSVWRGGQARLTWQATPRNKVGLTWAEQVNCECPQGGSATAAPETSLYARYPNLRQGQADWTVPITSRLLWESGALLFAGTSDNGRVPGLAPEMISVSEQSSGLLYRSGFSYRNSPNRALHMRGALSFIPGAHAFKVGFDHKSGWATDTSYVGAIPVQYRFNNGVPNLITLAAYPYDWTTDVDHDMGVFAQDKWTVHRLTATYGLRFDWFKSSSPEQHLGPTVFTPGRDLTFAAQDGASLKDLTPRLGVAYDLFGNGKTAVKATLNRYVQGLSATGIAAGLNPVNRIVVTTTRSWADANRNFVPDCSLVSPAANGECGAMANANFGTSAPGASFDPEISAGWGKRNYNWEFSTGVQRQLLPRMSLDVSYFRRWFGNFAVTDNTLAAPSDYTPFSITAPLDPRLPGGGGYTIGGLYDLNPNKVGQVSDLITLGDNYGKMIRHWDGVDVSVSSRPRNGLVVQGGVSTGRELRDYCDVIGKLPEILSPARQIGPRAGALPTLGFTAGASGQFCHQAQPLRTMLKALGSYTVPRIDVLLSATLQDLPGPAITAAYTASNASVAPSLGRPLSGNAANVTVGLVSPSEMFGERSRQLDLRLGKVLRVAGTRASINFDLFNALNASPVLALNNNFGAWQRPTVILAGRLFKIGVQFDF